MNQKISIIGIRYFPNGNNLIQKGVKRKIQLYTKLETFQHE